MCSPIQCLDVLRIHVDGSSGVFNDLVPFAKRVVACCTVGVEHWIWFAQDGLTVQLDGLVVVLGTVRLVAFRFQLSSVCGSVFGGEGLDIGLVDLR